MRAKLLIGILLTMASLILMSSAGFTGEPKTILIHLKTSLKHDDAQICVAYNAIWAALEEGLKVNVLIDADAVNTYKTGMFGKDDIENYKLPENMRQALARQFNVPLEKVPTVYGEYLTMLKEKGAKFYINEEMLITAGIAKGAGDLGRISAKFFKPVTMPELIRLRTGADSYLVY
ncbi:MAG: hypothetical protein HZA13_05640 [Nitrospirae bacterium]|nr:hypothetical protein [Nitrospirota bacterium]